MMTLIQKQDDDRTPEAYASDTITKILTILIERLGDVALSEAKTWIDVEDNARRLLEEKRDG